MTENILSKPPETESAAPVIHVSPSPHLADQALTTQRIMLDVVIGLVPVIAMALYMFRLYAVKQLAICVTCGAPANYTQRLTSSDEQIEIGAGRSRLSDIPMDMKNSPRNSPRKGWISASTWCL